VVAPAGLQTAKTKVLRLANIMLPKLKVYTRGLAQGGEKPHCTRGPGWLPQRKMAMLLSRCKIGRMHVGA
jgi:hypothetical protein